MCNVIDDSAIAQHVFLFDSACLTMAMTIYRTSSLLSVCKTPHTSCLIFLSFPPSLAWGFYNSLRRKSIASYKEPQVRNSSLILLPFFFAVQTNTELLSGLHASTWMLHASPSPPSHLQAFLLFYSPCMFTPGQSSFDLILLVLVVNAFRCWIFLSRFVIFVDFMTFFLSSF